MLFPLLYRNPLHLNKHTINTCLVLTHNRKHICKTMPYLHLRVRTNCSSNQGTNKGQQRRRHSMCLAHYFPPNATPPPPPHRQISNYRAPPNDRAYDMKKRTTRNQCDSKTDAKQSCINYISGIYLICALMAVMLNKVY